jgi:flagellar motility protein MotE (MotC chaperone)
MVQLGQASTNAKGSPAPSQAASASIEGPAAAQPGTRDGAQATNEDQKGKAEAPKAMQGPALEVPQEVLDMLDARKRDLDRREEAVRHNEERLTVLRGEVEKLLVQNEAAIKRIETARAKDQQQAAGEKTAKAKALLEKERLAQEQKLQLAKMYETMPSEDAAIRLERMPDRAALQILRLVKTKTAGAILAQVKPERAAKLTEQLLSPAP